MINSVLARILLRVLAGILIGWGANGAITNELTLDPEVIDLFAAGLGTTSWAISEYWYRLAKKMGWKT